MTNPLTYTANKVRFKATNSTRVSTTSIKDAFVILSVVTKGKAKYLSNNARTLIS